MINYQLYYERYKRALETLWEISTDNSVTEENKVKIIRDVSRASLDGEPTTADIYNKEELEDMLEDKEGYLNSEKES